MKTKSWAVFGLVIAAGIFPAWSFGGAKENAKYRTAAVTRGDVMAIISSTGILNPAILVEVGSEVSGLVTKVNVDFNAAVRKGEVLAELDRAPFEDDVKQNEAALRVATAAFDKSKVDLDTAKKKYDRTLDLYQKKLVSEEEKETDEEAYLEAKDDLKIAEAGVKEAAAQLEASRLDLEKTLIRSPIDGVVVIRNVGAGQTVTARFQAPVLFTIANDLRLMRLQCDVDESQVGRVREGQKVEFTVEAFPADTFTGRVIQVQDNAEVDSDVVRYPTVCEVDNTRTTLRPGMTATVTIHTGEAHGVLRVPNAALHFVPPVLTESMKAVVRNASKDLAAGQSPSIVWRLDQKGALTPVLIKTGLAGPDFVEITGGDLREGQPVVTGVIDTGIR
jgi:HlyD family secretion protein